MEKFAGYGFNKSHAAAYALLAYHTAWLKVHYPAEFSAANMSVEMDDTDKLKIFHDDAVALGMAFEPPDVNPGGYRFEPVADKVVRYGLGAIKGTGQGAIEAIVAARERGGRRRSSPVRLLRARRPQPHQQAHRRGADQGRRLRHAACRALVLVASIGLAFDFADTQAANADQGGLFDFGRRRKSHAASTQEPELVAAEPWSIKERLTLREDGAGLLPLGPPVRPERRRGAAVRASAASPT